MNREEEKRSQDRPDEPADYSNGNGTGAEWTAEGIARINGYAEDFYRANEMNHAANGSEGGREMDEPSSKQLAEKQEMVNAFLDRQGAKKEAASESPVEQDRAGQDDSPGNTEVSLREKIFNTMAAGVMATGLYQGVADVDRPVFVDSSQYGGEVVLSVEDGDSDRNSLFESYASNFKDVSGESLYDAAYDIADELKKRDEGKNQDIHSGGLFSETPSGSSVYKNPDGVDPSLLDDGEFRLEDTDDPTDSMEKDPEKTNRFV